MTTRRMIARWLDHLDTAIEAVINAVIDVIFAQWIEETARAAKEEGE